MAIFVYSVGNGGEHNIIPVKLSSEFVFEVRDEILDHLNHMPGSMGDFEITYRETIPYIVDEGGDDEDGTIPRDDGYRIEGTIRVPDPDGDGFTMEHETVIVSHYM